MKTVRIAITKGRLLESSLELFEKSGIDCSVLREKSRKLIFMLEDGALEVLIVKAADVITYVEHGVCDAGIVGKDTIMESGREFYEVADLGFGRCRFAFAGIKDREFYGGFERKTIATKYPVVAREFFKGKNLDIDVIKIEGSVEIAPLLGLADGIVDIVETGTTLKENGLEIIEEIAPISARFIVNTASMKIKKNEIEQFLKKLGNQL